MNITYLIGNGFDLNLGMHTKYADFIEWLNNPETTSNDAIDKLRERLGRKTQPFACMTPDVETAKRIYDEFQEIIEADYEGMSVKDGLITSEGFFYDEGVGGCLKCVLDTHKE